MKIITIKSIRLAVSGNYDKVMYAEYDSKVKEFYRTTTLL
ncbi:hypothetical protein J2Z43_002440 [Clostridioides mangenotii]|uniref:Uncharacterized protein n=1 Tax=Metaclostridioides mangenotii TaxID=1540 RepID=A0ABS4EDM4_9FIRM|nr:hypothetical protein [Clostridioides mangenotii]